MTGLQETFARLGESRSAGMLQLTGKHFFRRMVRAVLEEVKQEKPSRRHALNNSEGLQPSRGCHRTPLESNFNQTNTGC